MRKIFIKFISIFLVLNLFLTGSNFAAFSQVFAQDLPPTSAPAPTSALPPTSAPPKEKSDVKPTSPPPDRSAPPPTSSPQPTSPPGGSNTPVPTSPVPPTSVPQPTSVPGILLTPTAVPSVTAETINNVFSPTPTGSNDSKSSGTDGTSGTNITQDSGSTTNGSVNDPANVTTGAFSTNNATETNSNWQEVLNNNLGNLQNKIDAISNTGFNSANFNTLQGQVFSGDSLATLNLLNKLNSNVSGDGGFSVFNIYDTYFGDLVFKFADGNSGNSFASASSTVSKNSITGSGSTNNAIADNSFKVKEANGNDAKIINDINLQAVSGKNTASYNTGDGKIQTGNATALANIINMANTNLDVSKWLIGVVNVFGNLAGNIVLPQDTSEGSINNTNNAPVFAGNSNTGYLSNNTAAYNNNTTVNYTANNTADVISNLNVSANTGNNVADANTGGGFVKTGSSDATVSNSTIANTNTVNEEGTVWMVIVNEMGKWVGHIIGAPWGATTASNSLPIAQTGGGSGQQSYSTLSENNGTGALSTNNATYNNTSETSITKDNKAVISNNITANADTGNNDAKFNTGAGSVDTGNAKTGLNLVNMVNTNVTAKKFVAILVNVMGNFLGNIVTPGQKTSNTTANANTQYGIGGTTNTTSGTNSAGVTPTIPQPTPTVYQSPVFATASDNVVYDSSSQQVAYVISNNPQNYPPEYIQAVNRAADVKKAVVSYAKQLSNTTPNQVQVDTRQQVLKRGLFTSPAFAKATETSFAGMLLGGASFKVNETWLSVVPLALLIFLLRRRKKFDLARYLNSLLEIVL